MLHLPPSQEIDEAKLYVGNLPSTMTEDKLRDMFARCGEIVEVKAMPHKHYAFVRFTHKDYAAAGIDMWSGQYVDGNQLTVKIAGVPGGSNKQQKQGGCTLQKEGMCSTTLFSPLSMQLSDIFFVSVHFLLSVIIGGFLCTALRCYNSQMKTPLPNYMFHTCRSIMTARS